MVHGIGIMQRIADREATLKALDKPWADLLHRWAMAF